ncbi:MAG: SBBP repeat-containing protein, partial [Thermodesulfobacteriota bacterium]
MRLFIALLLQFFVFLPLTSLAADVVKTPLTQKHKKTEITEAQKAEVINSYGKLPLYFIENKGQVDAQVKFYERGAGHATFFTGDGVVIALTKSEGKREETAKPAGPEIIKANKGRKHTTEAVSLSFVGANKKAKISADEKMSGKVNYFVGSDRSKWGSNVPTYGAVTYKDIYKNIDVKFYGNNKNIEHDVIIRPGGDPSLVKFAYKGAQGLKVTKKGGLEVILKNGKIIEQAPVIYQEIKGTRVAVDGAYKLLGQKDGAFSYGFDVASYDHDKTIVIDPVLTYSTYLGGNDYDESFAIAVDSTGAAYVTGDTYSPDFPLMNPMQGTNGGGNDVFITKVNPAGSALVYSTYLGGNGLDDGQGIAVDASGNAYVAGNTRSTDFPLATPIQGVLRGGIDAFVTKINPAGSALVYSTYLGGSGIDNGHGIAVDASGNAYVTGHTLSTDFPLTSPIQGINGGGGDAFVTNINPAGSTLIYSTYLGGSDNDWGYGIAIDASGNAYVTGYTDSTDFPLMNPIQGTFGGVAGFIGDAFVTTINPAGSALVYSTYLGGGGDDWGQGIAVDTTGAAYVTGFTDSTDFPLASPIQGVYGGGFQDAFITKVNPTGSALVYSTYLGGSGFDDSYGIAIDASGNAYVTGGTNSIDFPLASPIQGTFGGIHDAFITTINPAGSALVYSTYLGGSDVDRGFAIAIDSSGAAYVAGQTSSADFPLVAPIQGVYGGGSDAFITKISGSAPPLPVIDLVITPDALTIAQGGTLGYTVKATNTTVELQCFNYWENVTMPGGGTYPPVGELFGPVRLCLNGSQSVHLTHGVP